MPPPNIGLAPGSVDAFRSSAGALGSMYRNLGSSPGQFFGSLGEAANASYGSTLDFQAANAKSIDEGYKNVLGSQVSANDALGRGYTGLSEDILSGLAGYGASQRQGIADRFAADTGAAGQSLVNRGLGNSTVVDSVNRGIASDRDKSLLSLADSIQQQRAGIQANIGMAGLGAQERGQGAVTGIGMNHLGWLNSINAPYPDAGMFSQLAQQYGMAGQADKDRATILGAAGAAGRATPQSSGTVSRGGGGFFTQPSDFQSGGTYQPQSFAPAPFRPPMGAVGSAAAGDTAKAYFDAQGGAFGGATAALGQQPPAQGGFDPGAAVGGFGAYGPMGAPAGNPMGFDYVPPEQGDGYYGYGAGPTAYGGAAGGIGSLYGAEANSWGY